MTLIEPDVALTDFALAAECALFAGWLWRQETAERMAGPGAPDGPSARPWFVLLFAALSAGSLLGGITHGFFGPTQTPVSRLIWMATLVSIAVAALACWGIGARLMPVVGDRSSGARGVVGIGVALFLVNIAVLLTISQAFVVAIAFYVPAVVLVLAALVAQYVRQRRRALLPGIMGVVLSLLAAVIQQTHTSLLGLTHNALYHVVQAVGLLLIFVTARSIGGARMEIHVSRETSPI